jgi:HEAT repeat protein
MTEARTQEEAWVRWQALVHLNRATRSGKVFQLISTGTITHLVEALADEHPFVRWQAALILANQSDGRHKLVELLAQQFGPGGGLLPSKNLPCAATIDALAAEKGVAISTFLIEALRSDDALLRQGAAESLAKQGRADAVPHLVKALNDEQPLVRRAAAYALGHLGNKNAGQALVESLHDRAVLVRRSAAYALGALRAEAGLAALQIALTDRDPLVRRNAAWALGRIGRAEAIPALTPLLTDPALDGMIATIARQAIEAITHPRWLHILKEAFGVLS